jgi:predicted dehydrogenase
MVGFKKMFVPANEKAAQLMREEGFGALSLIGLHYPQFVPEAGALRAYLAGERVDSAVGFLDHLCHPVSLLLHLAGVPATVFYERSAGGGGFAVFRYASGAVASLCLVHGASANMGMERTVIIGDGGGHVVVENNLRLYVHRSPSHRYGASPDYYGGGPEDASAVWEPEFSLGQLYNKGLFLLGYYGEVNEFARSVLEDRPPRKGTLEQAWQATRIFEAFAEGPGKVTPLAK